MVVISDGNQLSNKWIQIICVTTVDNHVCSNLLTIIVGIYPNTLENIISNYWWYTERLTSLETTWQKNLSYIRLRPSWSLSDGLKIGLIYRKIKLLIIIIYESYTRLVLSFYDPVKMNWLGKLSSRTLIFAWYVSVLHQHFDYIIKWLIDEWMIIDGQSLVVTLW